ncbi:hypothetical protein BJV78DRAFT_530463 [Lactifluus subvellereus]|nr:hypothetical protein BJV78DRAFT_530463 [Lactifluus subvellereus]
MNVWILIVQPDLQPDGRPFKVKVNPTGSVEDMKLEVKRHSENTLTAIDIRKFIVWKTEGEEILDFKLYGSGGWENVLRKIRKTLRVVNENEIVGNLGLSDNQILLVQIQILPDQVTAIDDEALVDEVEVEVKVKVEETNEYKRISNPLYLIECR